MLQFKAMFQSAVGRFTGDTDILEGVLAIGLGVAAADGSISRDEVATTVASAKANPLVSRLFTDDVIDVTKDKFLAKVRANGMNAVYKELKDLSAREETVRHAVYACGCSVAAHDGIDAKEQAILDRCADTLNILAEDKKEIEANATQNKIAFDF